MARAGFILLAGALLVAGLHSAFLRGWADASYTHARLALEAGRGKPSAEALATARVAIDEALRFEPSNPHFVEQSALLRGSLDEFHAAALMRPGSPYVWASIAMLKLRRRELDAELYGALERAAQLGPWEPQVQLAIAQVGLAAWRRLPPPAQAQVIGMLERGLLRQEAGIRRIAAAHDDIVLVCSGAALPPRLAALCVKI
jgi:hypothetical protein